MKKLRINEDALKQLPTWKVAVLFLATTAGALAAFYMIGALVLGWPGAKWALGVVGLSGVFLILFVRQPFVKD